MDISALASMKSAAKCDTWCELQNPANHREFERKLRPRPSGQGHVRLGVKRYAAPCHLHPTLRVCMRDGRMCRLAPRGRPAGTTGLRAGDRLVGHEQQGWTEMVPVLYRGRPRREYTQRMIPAQALVHGHPLGMRPQDGRGHPLSLSISISGGEETYKDSPSNGERTGKGPAWESGCHAAARIVVWRSVLSDGPGPSPLERGAGEGESPVRPEP